MTVNMKKGDRLPVLRASLTNADGSALNLTGGAVVFRMRSRTTGAMKIAGSGTSIIDAVNGVVEYAWGATDTDTAGLYDAEFVVTLGGLAETVPSNGYLLVVVEEGLA